MDWIKVTDQLPEKYVRVLVWAPNGKNQIPEVLEDNMFDGSVFYRPSLHGNRTQGVTHWMYLPKPPEDEYELD